MIFIRTMTESDIPAAVEIEAVSIPTPWNEAAFRAAMNMPDNILLVAYEVKNADDGTEDILKENDAAEHILGYCCTYVSIDEGELTNIAVSPSARKRGIGRQLLEALMQIAEQKNIQRIILEVRSSNEPAQTLYRMMGFEEIAVRKDFYENPKEDALIMEFNI